MKKKSLVYLFGFLLVLILTLTGFYLYKTKSQTFIPGNLKTLDQLVKKTGLEFQILQVIDAYESRDESSRIGTLHPGFNFIFLESKGQWWKIRTIAPENSLSWEGWIKQSKSDYKEVEEK